jgi:2-hydroxychromene-2-carboxylate isomerase
MNPASAPLQFYFDFISPYGYFASLRIDDLAARHGRTVTWHPMLLGVSVMKVMGLKPLMEIPLKGPYVRRDVLRYARRHGIVLQRDLDAPVMNPLTTARAFCWTSAHHPDAAKPLARAMLHAHWREGRDLSEPDSLAGIALTVGLDADQLVSAVRGAEAAGLLRQAVETSLAAGVFGSPTVAVDGELFWGVEKFDELEAWLASGGW